MEKNILLEIHRMNELMGIKRKPLIMEQGFFGAAVRMFIKKGLTFDQALDDAAELLVSSGKMGRKEADEAILLLKSEKSIVDDINKTYKNSKLAATLNDDLRIAAKIDDLIKKSGSTNLDDFIKGIKLVTQKEVDFITSELVKTMIKDGKFAQADDIFLNIFNPDIKTILREKLQNSKSKLNLSDFVNSYETASKTLTEIYIDYFKEYLKGKLDIGKLSKVDYDKTLLTIDKEFGEPVMQFLKDKHKYTNDSEIMSIIDEYRVAGRLDEGPGTITKPIYGKNNVADNIAEFRTDGKGKSFFRSSDDNLPVNVNNNLPDVITDDIPLIDWDGLTPAATEVAKKSASFITKIGHIQLDFIYNSLRSFLGFRKSKTYLDETQKVVNALVEDFLPKFRSAAGNVTDPDQFSLICRQLLLDMKLAKSSGQSWDELWEAIKQNIRTQASNNGATTQDIDTFIKAIEKGGGYSGPVLKRPQRTIEFFLQTMSEIASKPTWYTKGTRKAWVTTDTFAEWLPLRRYFTEFTEELTVMDKKFWQPGGMNKLRVTFLELPKFIWKWFSGWLLYRAPKTFQRIINEINFGGMTDGNAIINLGKIYLMMMITKNLILPTWEGVKTFFSTLLSDQGMDVGGGSENMWETIANEYAEQWEDIVSANPEALNPFGKGGLITLSEYIIYISKGNPEDKLREKEAEWNRELSKEINKNLKSKSEENKRVWDSSDEKKRELIKTKNGFKEIERILVNYTNPALKTKNPNFVPLTYEQYNKIKESLVFIPELDPSIIKKIELSTFDEKKKSLKRDVDLYHQVNDVMGYTAIRAKDGKHYKVVQRDLWLHYMTPSIEDIKVNPNVEQKQNDLNTILDKL
jgi:hypothetical protein